VSHLSLNYLTLSDGDTSRGAAALRDLLRLYADENDAVAQQHIGGIRSIRAEGCVRRLPKPGPLTFGRALEITVDFEEEMFEGSGMFVLGAVLEQFFRKYASINSMTETVIRSTTRGEVHRWPIRMGRRHTL
jgi:type VI secretion system protein ImpG